MDTPLPGAIAGAAAMARRIGRWAGKTSSCSSRSATRRSSPGSRGAFGLPPGRVSIWHENDALLGPEDAEVRYRISELHGRFCLLLTIISDDHIPIRILKEFARSCGTELLIGSDNIDIPT